MRWQHCSCVKHPTWQSYRASCPVVWRLRLHLRVCACVHILQIKIFQRTQCAAFPISSQTSNRTRTKKHTGCIHLRAPRTLSSLPRAKHVRNDFYVVDRRQHTKQANHRVALQSNLTIWVPSIGDSIFRISAESFNLHPIRCKSRRQPNDVGQQRGNPRQLSGEYYPDYWCWELCLCEHPRRSAQFEQHALIFPRNVIFPVARSCRMANATWAAF